MEQGKRKEALHKEAEMLPPRNVSGESDDKQNSRVSLETMDTDQCIQKLVRTEQESSYHTQCKIEETVCQGTALCYPFFYIIFPSPFSCLPSPSPSPP